MAVYGGLISFHRHRDSRTSMSRSTRRVTDEGCIVTRCRTVVELEGEVGLIVGCRTFEYGRLVVVAVVLGHTLCRGREEYFHVVDVMCAGSVIVEGNH